MEQRRETEFSLSQKLKHTFIHNGASTSEPHVVAAVATAASEMSTFSDFEGIEAIVSAEVVDIFGKTGDKATEDLIGMSPSFIKGNIGYSVDVRDFGNARTVYEAEKAKYDDLYLGLLERSKAREQEKAK